MKKLADKIKEDLVNKAMECQIDSNIPLSDEDKSLLYQLNQFAVMQMEDDAEVLRDPRKIFYKADEELKTGLVALSLAIALTKHYSHKVYSKEFLADNIRIENKHSGDIKRIDFGNINSELAADILEEGLIFDWMVYRDNKGRGIMGLADYKGVDLEADSEFRRGGTPVYEFARFERKYYKYMREKISRQKDDMQDAFRKVFAEEAAKQLAAQINPVEFAAKLFTSNNPAKEISNMLKMLDNKSEQLKIEYKDKKN